MRLFLHGRLADPSVVPLVLPDAAHLGPARLAGHAGRPLAAGLGGLAEAPGGEAGGLLVEAGAPGLDRLDFVMAALGARRADLPLAEGAGGPAGCYLAAPDLPDPLGDDGPAHSREVLAEILALRDGRDPAGLLSLLPGISARALARARGAATATPATVRRARGPGEIRSLAVARPYSGFFGIEEHEIVHRRFDGAMSPVLTRGVFVSSDAVTVVPYDAARDTVLIIEQLRIGPFARRDPQPWCLEAIAGRCEAGEPPEASARREAIEEAGLPLGRVERIAAYYTSPGIAAEYITAFAAEAALPDAGGVFGLPEEGEDIRTLVLPLDAALGLIETGEINNAPLMLSLLWLDRNRARLAQAWAPPLDAARGSR